MDTTIVNAVCIGFVSFVMVQVCLAMPADLTDDLTEYDPTTENSLYTEACVFCFAFQHPKACQLCDEASIPEADVNEVMIKRSGDSYYHPFLRGGYPKKSYYYNPLLRGSGYKKSYAPKPRIYHPFLRGGFGKYNPPSTYP